MATRFNRHTPRLCRDCGAPMASQADSCWRCAAVWDTAAPNALMVMRGAKPVRAGDVSPAGAHGANAEALAGVSAPN